MDKEKKLQLLEEAFAQIHLQLESYQYEQFLQYYEMLIEKKDEIRRLEAILSEYTDSEFAEHLSRNDNGKFEEMKKLQRALVTGYAEYVRQRLKEHLGNPISTSALSEENCVAILARLDQELAALDKAYIGYVPKEKTMASNEPAA